MKTLTNYQASSRKELLRDGKTPTGIFVDLFGGWEWYSSGGHYYHTDAEGNGLWCDDRQELGTCQFSLPNDRKHAMARLRKSGYDVA